MQNVNLPELLSARDMNMAGLAERVGVNRSTVTRWAKRAVPAERMGAVSRVTGIPMQDLRPDLFAEPAE